MLKKPNLIYSLLVIFCLLTPSPILAAQTSQKKGVGLDPYFQSPNTNNLLTQLGVSWFYTWNMEEQVFPGKQFVPMIMAVNTNDYGWYTEYAGSHKGSYWLIWNEPDYINDHIDPGPAASLYKGLRKAIKDGDSTAKMIIGNFYYQDTSWIKDFVTSYKNKNNGEEPQFEGIGFHNYMNSEYTKESWRNFLINIHNDLAKPEVGLGNKEFWLTEFSSLQTNVALNSKIINDQIDWLDAQPWITRYAWFFAGSGDQDQAPYNLFANTSTNPTLSTLGQLYAGLPTNPNPILPSPTPKTPTPTAGISPSPTPLTNYTCALGKKGDANCDNKIDGIDYSTWFNFFGKKTLLFNKEGDFSGDGNVDGIDYSVWFNNFTGK